MAVPMGGTTIDLAAELCKHGPRFSFIQAMRMLRLLTKRTSLQPLTNLQINRMVRIRPKLSLDFAETDIEKITRGDFEIPLYIVTVTFLGLYGASSPLPTFYTEDLLQDESDDNTLAREFLDIINAPLYPMLYESWSKHRLVAQIAEEKVPEAIERMYCLLGLPTDRLQQQAGSADALLRHIGLATQLPRSAEGLRTLIADRLAGVPVEIVQCVPARAPIPEIQRFRLGESGNRLDEDAYLGTEIEERMSKFQIRIGPMPEHQLESCLPDSGASQDMARLVSFYVDQPLNWEMELVLRAGEITTTCLGSRQFSRLGWDCWIMAREQSNSEASVCLTAGDLNPSRLWETQ
jgi:type VI secretion system protein ImpH